MLNTSMIVEWKRFEALLQKKCMKGCVEIPGATAAIMGASAFLSGSGGFLSLIFLIVSVISFNIGVKLYN